MREGAFTILFIVFIVIIALDTYAFKGVRVLTRGIESTTLKQVIHYGYWGLTIIVLITVMIAFTNFNYTAQSKSYVLPFAAMAIVILHVVPKILFIVFHLLEDIGFLGIWGYKKLTSSPGDADEIITRSTFLTKVGLTLATAQIAGFVYGIAKGRYDFRIEKETIAFDNLPEEFDGFTVAQISDIHIGSFFNSKENVQKGIDMVNSLNADAILFTGDLVNNYAWELEGMEEVLGQLKAPMGVYSILGNHDYGDYVEWESDEAKAKNLATLKETQKKMGFQLLINETKKLERNGKTIDLVGIENWGKGRFAKYGDLNKALEQSDDNNFQILLSHDPSHWDEQVINKTKIDIAFAGHTHGMQYGVKIAGFEWSPVKYKYPRWGGLYTEGKQHLYVNRGFGYLGFPGRVGMPPEITFIEFRKKV
jgi:predicted MPP superfamily phosphohydrolase